jgi:hypothetical protein
VWGAIFSFFFFLSILCWVFCIRWGSFGKGGANLQIGVAFAAEGAGFVTRGVVVGGGFPMRRCAGRGYSRSTMQEEDSRRGGAQVDATLGVPSGLP